MSISISQFHNDNVNDNAIIYGCFHLLYHFFLTYLTHFNLTHFFPIHFLHRCIFKSHDLWLAFLLVNIHDMQIITIARTVHTLCFSLAKNKINFSKSSWKWHFERENVIMSQLCNFWGMHVDLVIFKCYETDVYLFSGPCFEGVTGLIFRPMKVIAAIILHDC